MASKRRRCEGVVDGKVRGCCGRVCRGRRSGWIGGLAYYLGGEGCAAGVDRLSRDNDSFRCGGGEIRMGAEGEDNGLLTVNQ